MKLIFEYRRSYGRDRYYPLNESARLLVSAIAERQCLEETMLEALKKCGARIRIIGQKKTQMP